MESGPQIKTRKQSTQKDKHQQESTVQCREVGEDLPTCRIQMVAGASQALLAKALGAKDHDLSVMPVTD